MKATFHVLCNIFIKAYIKYIIGSEIMFLYCMSTLMKGECSRTGLKNTAFALELVGRGETSLLLKDV